MGLGDVLSHFDLIDKADGLIRGVWFTARGRGSASIEFTPPSGSSAGDMERILWKYRIPVYGRELAGKVKVEGGEVDKFSMRTTQTQRSWAEYVLLRAGATVWNLQDPANVQWAAQYQTPPPAWADGGHPRQDASERQAASSGAAPKKTGPAARLKRELW